MDQLTVATHNVKMERWIARIRECKASGQTVETWCESNGLDRSTYYYWHRKIKKEAFEALPTTVKAQALTSHSNAVFAEVTALADETTTIESPMQAPAVRIQTGTLTLDVLNGAGHAVRR